MVKNIKKKGERKYKCDDCGKKATYKCNECGTPYCKFHAEGYGFECMSHEEPRLEEI